MKNPLQGLLAVLVALPAFAILWHREGGEVVYVLYRQPKLATLTILGWIFLALVAWRHLWCRVSLGGQTLNLKDLRCLVDRPGGPWLLAFVGYMALTGIWVRVGANYRYELRQYFLLLPLTAVLVVWMRRRGPESGEVRQRLISCLTLSMAVLTAVGWLQLWIPLSILSPINPDIGAVNPSFMGYKNPMALALLGQLFLVAYRAKEGRHCLFWRVVLVLELAYLATLGSRTSYGALAVAALYLAWLWLRGALGEPAKGRSRWQLGGLGLAAAVFCLVLVLHPTARQKASSVLSYAAAPSRYLDSDRGIYLRNTVHMASLRPWGVGLGDWQTHYPLYRKHGRDIAFDDTFQVRRAHSDHVQILGEGGWAGALLWAAFLVTVGRSLHRRAGLSSEGPFLAAQWVAFVVAMGSDYLLELPYNKFQFFLVLALAWTAASHEEGEPETVESSKASLSDGGKVWRGLVTAGVLMAMVSSLFAAGQLLRRTIAAASVGQAYAGWVAGDAAAWPEVVRQVARHEASLQPGVGESKTLHKDFLLLAQIAENLGRRPQALAYAELCLRHHPYYSPAYRLLAELTPPSEARRWRQGYEFLMQRAEDGWEGEFPPP